MKGAIGATGDAFIETRVRESESNSGAGVQLSKLENIRFGDSSNSYNYFILSCFKPKKIHKRYV